MISVKSTGSFKKLESFLKKMSSEDYFKVLDALGQRGVAALASATPVDSGLTSQSWAYEVTHARGKHSIEWYNTNINNGVNIAIILQYGHGTGTGGWVKGYDYINPAIRPVFDQIADEVWKQVKNA